MVKKEIIVKNELTDDLKTAVLRVIQSSRYEDVDEKLQLIDKIYECARIMSPNRGLGFYDFSIIFEGSEGKVKIVTGGFVGLTASTEVYGPVSLKEDFPKSPTYGRGHSDYQIGPVICQDVSTEKAREILEIISDCIMIH